MKAFTPSAAHIMHSASMHVYKVPHFVAQMLIVCGVLPVSPGQLVRIARNKIKLLDSTMSKLLDMTVKQLRG